MNYISYRDREICGNGQVRPRMNGGPPDAYNCFSPSYGQVFNLSIQVIARDVTMPSGWFAWTLPLGVLSAVTGRGSAAWTEGASATLAGTGADGARVAAGADKVNGCLSLAFAPPPGNSERWEVTAHVEFAVAP